MNKVGFRLDKIRTNQFAIIEGAYNSSNNDIDLGVSFQFGVSDELSSVKSIVKIQFEQEKKPFLIIEVACEYSVEKTKWEAFSKGKKIIIPKGFLAHLMMLTIGTARGILHTKTENTIFNEFILPTINVSEMITEDGEFEK